MFSRRGLFVFEGSSCYDVWDVVWRRNSMNCSILKIYYCWFGCTSEVSDLLFKMITKIEKLLVLLFMLFFYYFCYAM